MIVTNSTIFAAPWAAACYAYDLAWWRVNLDAVRDVAPDAVLASMSPTRLDPVHHVPIGRHIFPGSSSGHQAVLWAALMGFTHICCLGMDMAYSPEGRRHFHAGHDPACATHGFPAEVWRADYSALCQRLRYKGIKVAQCSPGWVPMPGARGMTQERWLQQRRSDRCPQEPAPNT